MSFINPHSLLTDIVIEHICYINETTPRPPLAHSSPNHPPIPRANSKTTLQPPFTHGQKHGTARDCKQSARMQPARAARAHAAIFSSSNIKH
jgi:hypothetical protein